MKCSSYDWMRWPRQTTWRKPRSKETSAFARRQSAAFTLIELLLVIVIVAILAALLLPVVSKAKGRGKQIECLNQLRQVGIASHAFAHDHSDRFPFQTPVKDGGTLELAQAAAGLGGDVRFAFRHFQALSNDLAETKLLLCPADKRLQADTFPQLLNEHISYFIATTAEYARPDSVLSGDRNIVAPGGNSGTILRISSSTEVAWTSDCHEFKGNLLFAGGHVERANTAGLRAAMRSPTGPVSAWVPVATPSSASSAPAISGTGGASGPAAGGGNSGGGGNAGNAGASGFATLQNFFQSPQNSPNAPSPTRSAPALATAPQPVDPPTPVKKPATNQIAVTTPTPAVPSAPEPADPATARSTAAFPGVLVIFVEPERCWTCWLLFLVGCVAAAVTLGVIIQRRRQKRQRQATAH